MGSCMKKLKFIHQFLTKFKYSNRKILNMLSSLDVMFIIKGVSDFYHDFSLPFLYYKIRKNYLTDMKQTIASCLPSINLFTAIFGHLFWCIGSKTTTKNVNQPFH